LGIKDAPVECYATSVPDTDTSYQALLLSFAYDQPAADFPSLIAERFKLGSPYLLSVLLWAALFCQGNKASCWHWGEKHAAFSGALDSLHSPGLRSSSVYARLASIKSGNGYHPAKWKFFHKMNFLVQLVSRSIPGLNVETGSCMAGLDICCCTTKQYRQFARDAKEQFGFEDQSAPLEVQPEQVGD
jgi:hypothetical protein